MKQSWVVGIIMLYVILQGLTMVLQVSSTGDATIWGNLNAMAYQNYAQLVGSSVATSVASYSAIWAVAATVIGAFMALGQAILLYYPAIFTGFYVWFWWIVCLPIAVGFIISIITIIRGVHAG